MKKIIIIIGALLIGLTVHSQEWIKKDGKDYKLNKIDTVSMTVFAEGCYKITITATDTTITSTGAGLGTYWFYAGRRQNITIPIKMQEALKEITYGKKEKI